MGSSLGQHGCLMPSSMDAIFKKILYGNTLLPWKLEPPPEPGSSCRLQNMGTLSQAASTMLAGKGWERDPSAQSERGSDGGGSKLQGCKFP